MGGQKVDIFCLNNKSFERNSFEWNHTEKFDKKLIKILNYVPLKFGGFMRKYKDDDDVFPLCA